ncbi:MAG: peptidylprolyl isomerase [Ruminiclostridium sp.]|nr:peptidylprolyl isomerase [Ruminiclostridium sp.]
MKKITKALCAAAVCGVMMLTGCSGSDNGTAVTAAENQASEARIIKSTGAGNSGEVTLEKGDTYAVISVRDYGDIKIKLFPDLAPYSVYNFTELAKRGDYNGRNFHRLIENFMIQGGSGNGTGGGGSSFDGGSFKNEINTSLRHYYGALCYAANGLGDLSDGFYIVNSKTQMTVEEGGYTNTASNHEQYAAMYQIYMSMFEEGSSEYTMYKKAYDYNAFVVNAAKAMGETITDAVKETYATKGGRPDIDGAYTVFGQTVEGFDVIDKITAVEKVDDGNGNISKPATEIIIEKVEIFTVE